MEHDEQAAHPTVTVEKGMDGLELVVEQSRAHRSGGVPGNKGRPPGTFAVVPVIGSVDTIRRGHAGRND